MLHPDLVSDRLDAISSIGDQNGRSHALGNRQSLVLQRLDILGCSRINRESQPTDGINRDAEWEPLSRAFHTAHIASSGRCFDACKHLIALETRHPFGCLVHRIIDATLAQIHAQTF